MNPIRRSPLVLALIPALIFAAGCEDRDPMDLDVARASTEAVVFDDEYVGGVYFQPFFETNYTAVTTDSVFAYNGFAPDGARSLKFEIAPSGSALSLAGFTGGVLTPSAARDLADYNALTFWARSDADSIKLDLVGMGNDNTGTSRYEASVSEPFGILLRNEWTFHVVPIPDATKLISERGLFTISEAPEAGYPNGHHIWFDDIEFQYIDELAVQGSGFQTRTLRRYFTGMTVGTGSAATAFQYQGGQIRVFHSSRYYDVVSSDPAAASVGRFGDVHIVGEGEPTITGTLQGAPVGGSVRMATYNPPPDAAPRPTLPASDVISMFSDAYDDVPVGTWRADWQGVTTQVQDFPVAGQLTKCYYDMNYVGVDLQSDPIDATGMTHFHLDVYAPAGSQIIVGIDSFSEDGTVQQSASVTLNSTTTPAFVAGEWSSLDIPLSDFPTSPDWNWGRIGIVSFAQGTDVQLQLMLVDNVYWHK